MSWKEFDFEKLDPRTRYRLMIEAIVPRPIAFVSTLSSDAKGNLAPFSFFNGVASNPPTVVFSVTYKRDGDKKDTLLNIEQTKEFVVNSVNSSITEKAHLCSADYPHGVDEMTKVGLTPVESKKVTPPRVKEAFVQMECQLYDLFRIGKGGGASTLVVGEIVYMHVNSAILANNQIDLASYHPVARLGGKGYSEIGKIFELERPQML